MGLPKSAFNVIRLNGILLPITVSTIIVSDAMGVPVGKESAPALYKLHIKLIFTDLAGVGVTENPKNRKPETVITWGASKN